MAAAAQHQPESAPVGVAGVWEITFDDPHIKGPVLLTLKQEGENVSGTYGRAIGKGDKVSGTLRGADLELQGGNRIIRIELSAILDGDSLKGINKIADSRFTWTAKRKGGQPKSRQGP